MDVLDYTLKDIDQAVSFCVFSDGHGCLDSSRHSQRHKRTWRKKNERNGQSHQQGSDTVRRTKVTSCGKCDEIMMGQTV